MGARSQVMGGILQGLGFALMEERVVDPTTGTVVNAGLEDYKIPTLADLPGRVPVRGRARPGAGAGHQGAGRAAHHPHSRRHRKRGRPRAGAAAARGALHAPPGAGGAAVRTFAYVRPAGVEEAAAALSQPAARAMGGGTDLLTQQDRGILAAESVVDLRGLDLDAIALEGEGIRIGATVTLADLGRDDAVRERFEIGRASCR